MPVTAKLSKQFYDNLGEETANELVEWFNQVDDTYRNDLRDLNELNFQRFDSKLEQRLAESDAKWEKRMAASDARWNERITKLDAKWEKALAESDAMWNERMVKMDAKWEKRFAEADVKLEQRFAELRVEMHELFSQGRLETARFKTEIKDLISDSTVRWETQFQALRVELIRWMFAFWVATVGLLLATRFL